MLLHKMRERGENPQYIEDIENLQNEILRHNQNALKEKVCRITQPVQQQDSPPLKNNITFSNNSTRSGDVF